MNNRPNGLQKIIHFIAMQGPVTDFFSTRLHKIDKFVLKTTKDRHSLSKFLGWPLYRVTTIGAKTGYKRELLINGFPYRDNIILIGSSFGRKHNPSWYYNLKKNPECNIQLNGRSGKFMAREATNEERKACWDVALTYYVGYEKYKERASHRIIPVMLLEPVK